MADFREVAVVAAKEAGKIHAKYFDKDVVIQNKGKSYDRVTIVDLEAEEKIIAVIQEHFPDHNILAEEGKYAKTDSEYLWIIDPLDGTNNFSHGLPIFSASIALAKDNELILGVVYDVSRDELFVAEKGKGATLNGKKITISDVKTLDAAILVTGFYYDRGPDMVKNLEKIRAFFEAQIVGVRRLGAATLDLCYVACGRVSGFWEFVLSPWDFAAGKLLIEEAGGKVTDLSGNPITAFQPSYVVSSNNKIHEQMLEILQ